VLHLPQLYVVAVLAGVLTVFFDVAYMSYVPVLVDPEQFVDANGKIGASQAFGQVAGPSVAGVLVGVMGAAYAIVVDALSFLVSGGLTTAMRRTEPAPAAGPAGRRLRDEVREGLAYVLRHPILRRIVGCTGTSNFFSTAFLAVEAVFMVRVLHASPGVIGLVLSLGSAGGLLGGVLAGRLARRFGSARIIWLSITFSAPCQLLAAAAFTGWGVALVGVSLFGFRHVDAHVREHRHDVLDLFGRGGVGGQHFVELIEGHEAALLGLLDHLLDRGIREVKQRRRRVGTILLRGVRCLVVFFLVFNLQRLCLGGHSSSSRNALVRNGVQCRPPLNY